MTLTISLAYLKNQKRHIRMVCNHVCRDFRKLDKKHEEYVFKYLLLKDF
jgi:hypothetical protein